MTLFALMAQTERRADRGDRQDVRRRLAAPDRSDDQLRHRLRAAVLARVSAGAEACSTSGGSRSPRAWRTPRRSTPRWPASKRSGRACWPTPRRSRPGSSPKRATSPRACASRKRSAPIAAAEQIMLQAREAAAQEHARMLAELRREVGRLVVQTTAAVIGKVLTPDDQRRLAEETARTLRPRSARTCRMKTAKQTQRDAKTAASGCVSWTDRSTRPAPRRVVRAARRRGPAGGAPRPVALSAPAAARPNEAPRRRDERRAVGPGYPRAARSGHRARCMVRGSSPPSRRTRRSSAACASRSGATSTTARIRGGLAALGVALLSTISRER